MLSENDVKEELSYAYLHCIAAAAGFSCSKVIPDRDSIDVTLRARRGAISLTGTVLSSVCIDIQLKATAIGPLSEEEFAFELPIKNYNDLRSIQRDNLALLVVYVLPRDKNLWLNYANEALTTQYLAYWRTLRDEPEIRNSVSKTVYINREQKFTADVLSKLMVLVSQQEDVDNDIR